MNQLGLSLSEYDVQAMMKSVGVGPRGKVTFDGTTLHCVLVIVVRHRFRLLGTLFLAVLKAAHTHCVYVLTQRKHFRSTVFGQRKTQAHTKKFYNKL